MITFKKFSNPYLIFFVLFFTFFISVLDTEGCGKWIRMTVNPEQPKQGDIVSIYIKTGKSSEVKSIKYKINNTEYTITSAPYTVNFNTCKSTGQYYHYLDLWGEVTYNDGAVRSCYYEYDLTVSSISRENSSLNYVFYLAKSGDDWQTCGEDGANGFINEFGSYGSHDYYWAEPFDFTSNCGSCANSYDMVIAWGHGSHHYYSAHTKSNGWVDLSNTSYGSFSACNSTGDPEYLVFASCQVLSMDDYLSNSFWYYWFNDYSTRLYKRPFQGLHMVLGFRTDMVVYLYDDGSSNSNDFFYSFAHKLDQGYSVIDAWLYADDEELSFDDGNNRGAVLYLERYEHDNISTFQDDFIYMNQVYNGDRQWIYYW